MALATQLARVVGRAASGRQVFTVRVAVGALRQVVPASLDYAWGFVIAGTPLEGADLQLQLIGVEVECSAGHITQVTGELSYDCAQCQAPTRIVRGEEFTVLDIDVAAADEPAAPSWT